MSPGACRPEPRDARAVVREEAVVCGGGPRRELEEVGVVGEPVGPARQELAFERLHVFRREPLALEYEDHVRRPAPKSGGETAGQGPAQNRVPAALALLIAGDFASERGECSGQRKPAPVIPAVERRDQPYAQARERTGRHT